MEVASTGAMIERIAFRDRSEFRAWLERNHSTSSGAWLVFGKAGGPKTLKPSAALEEALCFGWIDGLIRKIDEQTYEKFFSPRSARSTWSEVNSRLAMQLVESGLIAAPGAAAIENAKKNGLWDRSRRGVASDEQIEILVSALCISETALGNFQRMPLSARRNYAGFYLDAKRDDTRQRRLTTIIDRLVANKKPV